MPMYQPDANQVDSNGPAMVATIHRAARFLLILVPTTTPFTFKTASATRAVAPLSSSKPRLHRLLCPRAVAPPGRGCMSSFGCCQGLEPRSHARRPLLSGACYVRPPDLSGRTCAHIGHSTDAKRLCYRCAASRGSPRGNLDSPEARVSERTDGTCKAHRDREWRGEGELERARVWRSCRVRVGFASGLCGVCVVFV